MLWTVKKQWKHLFIIFKKMVLRTRKTQKTKTRPFPQTSFSSFLFSRTENSFWKQEPNMPIISVVSLSSYINHLNFIKNYKIFLTYLLEKWKSIKLGHIYIIIKLILKLKFSFMPKKLRFRIFYQIVYEICSMTQMCDKPYCQYE